MKDKLNWVFSLKFVGIIAVVLGHFSSPFSEFIYSWHMPLFFMLSGFFITVTAPLNYLVKKDFNRLMVPYFIFSFIALIITALKLFLLGRPQLNYVNEALSIIFWMDYEHLKNTYGFALWFLPALFLGRIFYYLVEKVSKNKVLQLIIYASLFLLSFKLNLPLGITNGLNCVIWIFIGKVIFNNLADDWLCKIKSSVALILSFGVIFSIYYLNKVPILDMSLLKYSDVILNLIWAVSILIFLVIFFKSFFRDFQDKSVIKMWAAGTMLLFITHPYTNNIAHLVAQKASFDFWFVKLFITLSILHLLLLIKERNKNWFIFKYV